MKKNLLFLFFLLLIVGCSGSQNNESQNELDEDPSTLSKANPQETTVTDTPAGTTSGNKSHGKIQFYFTPSVDENLVREKGVVLLSFLEKETKLEYDLHIPDNYDEMIEDFGTEQADVAIMNSLSYVKASNLYGVSAKLRGVRYGKSTYFGQLIGNTDRGINNLNDIQGKVIAFTDSSSTSGYLFPQQILNQSGIKPSKKLFAGKHDEVVRMVYQGKADAGATFYSEPAADGTIRDARARLVDQYPDVVEKIKILKVTEPIPNDPVVFSKNLPDDISYKISLGLIKFMTTEEGKKTMKDLYSLEGFVRCSDADYNTLRNALNKN